VANNGIGGEPGTGYPGYSNWSEGSSSSTTGSWETWIGRRGDVARAQLYMDLRYEGGVHGVTGAAEPDLILTDDAGLISSTPTGDNEDIAYMGELSVLLAWHWQDPPDDLERRRNDVVASYQGNRNPFVDHPEWVHCVFENDCETPLFADDFESSLTDAWSAAVGGR
jgi:endonuclease I